MKKKMRQLLFALGVMALCAGCGQSGDAVQSPVKDDAKTAVENTDAQSGQAQEETDFEEVSEKTEDEAADKDETDEVTPSSEEAPEEDGDLAARDLFADFVMGKTTAKVAGDFVDALSMTEQDLTSGAEFDVQGLKEMIQKNELIGDTAAQISYAPLSCHGKSLYALQIHYEGNMEEVTVSYILSDASGELEFKFAADGWSRRCISLNENGVVTDSGSNGAGSHSYTVYAPDASLAYHRITDMDEEYYGYSFYDENGEPNEALNATMEEAGSGNADAMNVAYTRENIDGKDYYYYLAEGITQETVDYIDGIAASHGFTFDGKNTADEARKAYEQKLGVEEMCLNTKEPEWKTLTR